jgi:glyoxylase-like metal-dependent hydrolase (beta-lactamase superfamily II)
LIKILYDNELVRIESGKEINGKVLYWTSLYYYKGIIIDTGCPATADEVFEAVSKLGSIKAVLLTHEHEDHIGGAYKFWSSGIKIYAPEKILGLLNTRMRLPNYRSMVWGVPKPFEAYPSEETMFFGDIIVKTIPTMGHGSGHVSYLIDDKIFIGDLIGSRKPVIAYIDEDYNRIIESIKNILKYDFKMAYGGHIILSYNEVKEVLKYLENLRERINKMYLDGYSIEMIVNTILGDVPDKVIWMEKLSEGEWNRKYLITSLLNETE